MNAEIVMPQSCRDFLERKKARRAFEEAMRAFAPGSPVWAAYGGAGWRMALVEKIGRRKVQIAFVDPKTGDVRRSFGSRLPEELRARDPKLGGKDKPRPLGEAVQP